jgi:hypothetical protein
MQAYVVAKLILEEGTTKTKKVKDREAFIGLGEEFTALFGPGVMRTEDVGINYFCMLCNTEPQGEGYFRAPVSDNVADMLQYLIDTKYKPLKGILVKVERNGQDMVPGLVQDSEGEWVDGFVEELFVVGEVPATTIDGVDIPKHDIYLGRMA